MAAEVEDLQAVLAELDQSIRERRPAPSPPPAAGALRARARPAGSAIPPLAPAGGELVTIAELAADPTCGKPVRAELKGIGGSADTLLVTATDCTGSVTVLLMRDKTRNFRETSGSGRYDLWLVPLPDGSPLPFTDAGRALYLATKAVPL